ncbi:MAG TPA: hypothetical protein VLT16_05350 [Candidatus Limnocylindrales bacterium]|nr:hypothetical protein [Candidatus Limnocylindrales bacterium]
MVQTRFLTGFSLVVLALLPGICLSQEQPRKKEVQQVKAAPRAGVPSPKLTEDQKFALDLLEASEASARGLEAPMRAFSLLQIASAPAVIPAKKARALLGDAFLASLEVHDDDDTKVRLQEDILRALLPLSLDDVQQLLPQAEPKVRKEVSEKIISFYTSKKEFEKAIDLVNQVTGWDEFPYASATGLMEAMPAEMAAEKQGLFIQAVNSYKNHTHENGMTLGGGTLTDMVTHFAAGMNPKIVLQAIDEILSQAKNSDEKFNITIGGQGGTVSFSSNYEYQLFALLPLLEQLDDERAKSLLEDNQSLQAKLQQFPQGVNSVNPPGQKDSDGKPVSGLQTSIYTGNSAGAGNAREIAAQETRRRVKEVVDESDKDPIQAIAHAMTLPLTVEGPWRPSPRAQALEGIARIQAKTNPTAAHQALGELRKISGDIPPRARVPHLAAAAGIYLEMNDKENAEKTVDEGFKAAENLLDQDINPDNPNKALKAWWPSADAYRRFVGLETKISKRGTAAVLKEIKDPDIRTFESIVYAQSLLGMPMKRFVVVEKRKGTNSFSIFEDN